MEFIYQKDSMDCGPSCLAMIAKYYKGRWSRSQIRYSCSLGIDGVSLLGISKAAESIGFKTIGGRLNFNTLAKEVPLPCIIHWNQNHFVVVYGIKKVVSRKVCMHTHFPGYYRDTRNSKTLPLA